MNNSRNAWIIAVAMILSAMMLAQSISNLARSISRTPNPNVQYQANPTVTLQGGVRVYFDGGTILRVKQE